MAENSKQKKILLTLSGSEVFSLIARLVDCAKSLQGGNSLAFQARESWQHFDARHHFRLALVFDQGGGAQETLSLATQHLQQDSQTRLWRPDRGVFYHPNFPSRDVALLFPGQGSQAIGMGQGMKERFSSFKEMWDLGTALENDGEISLAEVIFPEGEDSAALKARHQARITATEWAQPAIGLTSAAYLALLNAMGLRPKCVAGHSFGEITALYSAGVIDFTSLMQIARKRGELMAQSDGAFGGMIAVTGPVKKLTEILRDASSGLSIANYNTPKQAVLAGTHEELEAIQAPLAAAGFFCSPLQVGAAFHSPLIANIQAAFAKFLREVSFREPNIPVYSNLTAAPYPQDGPGQRQILAQHLASPVRFQEMIEAMYASGVRVFLEVGTGQTLSRLVDKCLQGREFVSLSLEKKPGKGPQGVIEGVAALCTLGIPLNLQVLDEAFGPHPISNEARLA